MFDRFEELDLTGVRTVSIADRGSKVAIEQFAKPVRSGMSVAELLESLPDILAARALRELIDRVAAAVHEEREWIVMLGGHVVKTGLAPVLGTLIERRSITCVAMNGAAAIHDVEIARHGKTSEDVEKNLADGSFGMARETADFLNGVAERAAAQHSGFGEALGAELLRERAPNSGQSLLAMCASAGIPATVHVALGTDVVHQHPSARGEAIGSASLRDFRILAARIAHLEGGVVLNVGSAVLLPEVFLKALTAARNLGHSVGRFAAADFDMIRHYRPLTNVVQRPTHTGGGWGAAFTGHHELLLPMFVACVHERLAEG
jgi:hypothetical protein